MIVMVDVTDELQFVYPSNPTLRKAYLALVAKVLVERGVVFPAASLTQAIIDGLGWIDDGYLDNIERPEGPNYKRAKNILRTFEGKFTKFNHGGLEVFVFRRDMKRVSTFEELEKLCYQDPLMNEFVATTAKLDLTQPWSDPLCVPSTTKIPVSLSLARIDEEIRSKEASVRTSLKKQKKKCLTGKNKGKNLAPDVLDGIKSECIG